MKELDENQSKKGLGEIHADEYAQKTGLVSQALTFSDEQKKEASLLFKKLCLKLDALSHFHFTPKPVIEDMSIQTNVPALAMEEIAPLAVSDAAMLAPEEVFSGKGDIKEEAELTQADRKRRRPLTLSSWNSKMMPPASLAGIDFNKSAIVQRGGLNRLITLSSRLADDPSVLQEVDLLAEMSQPPCIL